MTDPRPRLYPLIAVPGCPAPPSTPEELAAFDAGMDGEPNPDPSNPRITAVWKDGGVVALDLAQEAAQARHY